MSCLCCITDPKMRKYIETAILVVVGLGPTVIALLLMQQYGAIGVSCAIVMSCLYLLCIIIALCCRICIPPALLDSDEEELQNDGTEDSPPSYEVVTSKPPPYYVLFASAPPAGECVRHARLMVPSSRPDALSSTLDVPVHTLQRADSNQNLKCYTWIEPCDDKDLPSYAEAVAPCSIIPSFTPSPITPTSIIPSEITVSPLTPSAVAIPPVTPSLVIPSFGTPSAMTRHDV